MWTLGMYINRAVSVAIDNCLGGKAKYFEKPFMEQIEEQNKELTEDEKITATKNLFMSLGIMQKNFELSKKNK